MREQEYFSDELLAAYAAHFYGYGEYDGDYWFIGMEEGGGDSLDEVNAKLTNWDKRGQRELEDLAEFHYAIGTVQWFRPHSKIQPTWSKFVRIILAAEDEKLSTESVRCYQTDQLGRKKGESCLLELLPLPSPSLGHWHYAHRSQLSQLRNRQTYMDYYAPRRAIHIRQKVQRHKPKAVVFSSIGPQYQIWWKEIAQVTFEAREIGR